MSYINFEIQIQKIQQYQFLFWAIDYQTLLLQYLMSLDCLLDLNIIHKRKKVKDVRLNVKSWLIFFIAILNAIQLVTSNTTTGENNNFNQSALNSNINSSQLARLLNIPVDQLNTLLLKQIKYSQPLQTIQSPLQPQPQTNILIQNKNSLISSNSSSLSPNSNINVNNFSSSKNASTSITPIPNNNQKLTQTQKLIDKAPSITIELLNKNKNITNNNNNQVTQITSSLPILPTLITSSNLITNSTATNVLLKQTQSTLSSSITLPTTTNNNNNNCNSVSQYWTGFRCACRVGYCYKNGNCERIMYQNQIIFPSPFNYNYYYQQGRSQIQIGDQNNNVSQPQASISQVKNQAVITINSNINQTQTQTTSTSTSISTTTIKSVNFQTPITVAIEQQKLTVICHINQIDNGLGTCICKSGYFRFSANNELNNGTGSGTCFKIQTTTLPSCYGSFYYQYIANMTDFSVKNITCKCYQGYNLYHYNNSTICRKCPIDSQLSPETNSCFAYCGANMRYNQIAKSCQCFIGFGKIKLDQCQICQQLNMILVNGYCVKCPLGSFTNFINQTCECLIGYLQNDQGICVKICPNNQILYSISDSNQKFCSCVKGLGISNSTGQCGLCPSKTYPSMGLNICIYCAENQILVNGKQCQCIKGYIRNKYFQCVSCLSSNLKNNNFDINRTTFLLADGSCAYCPGNQSYINNTCTCQPHYKIIGISCVPIICPLYQQLSNNTNQRSGCQCVQFYTRNNITKICQLFCQADQQKAGNICIKIKCNNIHQIYVSNKGGCICVQGYIKNSFGVCQNQSNFINSTIVSLNSSENILIQNTRTNIMNISSRNSSSNNNNNNTSSINSGGDVKSNTNSSSSVQTIIINNNNTSSSNVNNANGSLNSTKTTINLTLTNQTNQTNLTIQTNLTLLIMNFNINNVYLQLQIPFNITFSTQQQMQNFMISNFPDPGTLPASVFCSQTLDNLTRFECLLIYPSGIPNKIFQCNFYYNYKGMHGSQTFKINPLSLAKIKNSLSSTSRLR